MNLNEIIRALRLPHAEREKLERLADLPAVRQAFDEIDSKDVDRRRELVALIASAEKRQAVAKTQATAALRDAEQRLAAAEAELAAASDAHKLAFIGSLNGAEASTRRAIAEATAELVATADQRIGEFKRHVSNLAEALRLCLVNYIGTSAPNFLGHREPIYGSNTAEVDAAVAVCRECLTELDGLRLAALSRAEVTDTLADWSARLADACGEFDLPLPLVDEHGAVAVTRPGLSAPAVLIERQAKADERAAVQAERAASLTG